MRGKQALLEQFDVQNRNIPAYAGKTCFDGYEADDDEEHPRVCGENLYMR